MRYSIAKTKKCADCGVGFGVDLARQNARRLLRAALGAVERDREKCDPKVRQNVRETGV